MKLLVSMAHDGLHNFKSRLGHFVSIMKSFDDETFLIIIDDEHLYFATQENYLNDHITCQMAIPREYVFNNQMISSKLPKNRIHIKLDNYKEFYSFVQILNKSEHEELQHGILKMSLQSKNGQRQTLYFSFFNLKYGNDNYIKQANFNFNILNDFQLFQNTNNKFDIQINAVLLKQMFEICKENSSELKISIQFLNSQICNIELFQENYDQTTQILIREASCNQKSCYKQNISFDLQQRYIQSFLVGTGQMTQFVTFGCTMDNFLYFQYEEYDEQVLGFQSYFIFPNQETLQNN